MTPEIIFLHIEKTAGSSLRSLFYDSFGCLNVYWHGIDESDLMDFFLVGGHESIAYYTDLITANEGPVYLAVLRNPVSRVISLYHHLLTHTDYFTVHKAQNFKDAIFKCEPFREHIRFGQINYISGGAEFSDFENIIQEKNFVVGTIDSISDFTNHLITQLDLNLNELQKHNVGEAGYQSRLEIDTETYLELENLVSEDKKLYDYIANQHQGLFSNVMAAKWQDIKQSIESLEYRQLPLKNIGFEGSCKFMNIAAIPKHVALGSSFAIDVVLTNLSNSVWTNDGGNINFSYHWLNADTDEIFIFEGIRTKISSKKILPKRHHEQPMKVASPNEPGNYCLKLVPMKAGLGWFEGENFDSGNAIITVS